MRKTIYTLLFSLAVGTSQAQDINKIITKNYVDNLIKTLSSDDMQGRRTFTPGIDKAATFIENEFKQIGLKTLEGQQTYRQTFHRYQFKPQSINVMVDGKAVEAENVFAIGANAEEVSFDKANSDGFVQLNPEKDFMSQYRTIARSGKKQLVLVDVKFADAFNRIKSAMAQNASTIAESDLAKKANPTVFVLDIDTVEKDFSVNIKNTKIKLELFNVVGVLPGKSKAKELVVFSGHYDHMGIVQPKEGDSIMNGADDDASGTSAMIALAKYYKAFKKNERTLIFVAFTAEEVGGFGARYFSEQLNPTDVVAMFNIEMIGKDSKFGKNTAFITGYERSDFGKILQKNLEGTEFQFHPDPYPDQQLFYRSDNATLAALGVPAHTISTDKIDVDPYYHTVKDEYSTLDVENILSTIKAIAKSAVTIVNGTDTPTRIPKLEGRR